MNEKFRMNEGAMSLKKQWYEPKSHLNFQVLQKQAVISKQKPCNWGIYQKKIQQKVQVEIFKKGEIGQIIV